LEWNNYYRVKPFFYLFLDTSNARFKEGVTLNDVMYIYRWDARIRHILFKACHTIEIGLRAQLIHHGSIHLGNNFYEIETHFRDDVDNFDFPRYLAEVNYLIQQSKEKIGYSEIKKHFDIYDNTQNTPAWKVIDLLSFGTLTLLFKYLKKGDAKIQIAQHFGFNKRNINILENWLELTADLRNLCAHHYSLYNRTYRYLKLSERPLDYSFIPLTPSPLTNRLYAHTCAVFNLLDRIEDHSNLKADFRNQMIALFKKAPTYLTQDQVGLIKDWQESSFWNTSSN